jgi:hypothetical protein
MSSKCSNLSSLHQNPAYWLKLGLVITKRNFTETVTTYNRRKLQPMTEAKNMAKDKYHREVYRT